MRPIVMGPENLSQDEREDGLAIERPALSSAPLILVVDDFLDAWGMLAVLVKRAGFRTIEAVNGREAIQKAVECHPAVILMDLAMPEMDGWEATRQLRADPRTRGIPVIAMTGRSDPECEPRARAAGFDALLAKPVTLQALLGEIQKLLPRSYTPPADTPPA